MPDPVGAERPEASTTGVIATGEHERDRVHRERLYAVALTRGDEEPARIRFAGSTRLLDKGWPSVLEVGGEGGPGLGLESDVKGLATLAPPETDQGPLEVDVLKPQESDARVAGRCRLEDRDDRPVTQVERSVSGAASLEGPDVVECRALRRRLLGGQEGIYVQF